MKIEALVHDRIGGSRWRRHGVVGVACALGAIAHRHERSALHAEYERQRDADRLNLNDTARARILALANDVPALWRDAKTPQRERKRVVRLLVEDETVLKGADGIAMHVRFKGGAMKSLMLPAPRQAWQDRTTDAQVVAEIDRLLDDHTCAEIAVLLNERGLLSACGRPFHGDRVDYLWPRLRVEAPTRTTA